MKKQITLILKKITRKELLKITAGYAGFNDEGSSGGGTNNGTGTGSVQHESYCLSKTETKCLYYDKCHNEYVIKC